jgi:hypothetical protein
MKKISLVLCVVALYAYALPNEIVIIRHAEKPQVGNNLSCKGFNRALALTTVLPKFGNFKQIYVPKVASKEDKTEHLRMLQTASPYAIYNGSDINSDFKKTNHQDVAKALQNDTGDVLVVWPHGNIIGLTEAIGVTNAPKKWHGNDFDTVFVITFENNDVKKPVLNIKQEGINPSEVCQSNF